MIKVNTDEIRRLKARLREINRVPVDQIQWVDDRDSIIQVHPDMEILWFKSR